MLFAARTPVITIDPSGRLFRKKPHLIFRLVMAHTVSIYSIFQTVATSTISAK